MPASKGLIELDGLIARCCDKVKRIDLALAPLTRQFSVWINPWRVAAVACTRVEPCLLIRDYLSGSEVREALEPFRHFNAVIVGGMIRDLLIGNLRRDSQGGADLDIVLLDNKSALVASTIGTGVSRNILGGYRWSIGSSVSWVDFWDLDQTVLIKELEMDPNLDNLLLGFPLNVDRSAYLLREEALLDFGAVRACASAVIEFDSPIPQANRVSINIARALSISRKTNMRIGRSVSSRFGFFNDKEIEEARVFLVSTGHPMEEISWIINLMKGR